jgi:putative glutamine amidotransferase
MKLTSYRALIVFLLSFLFSYTQINGQPFKVALTRSSPNYISWLTQGDSSIILIDLNNLNPAEAIQKLHECAALVLTGGGDIDPSLYNNDDKNKVCQDIDKNRDILEKAVIIEALALKMPILGICRGEQMLNVALGGTLITDIPSYLKSKSQVSNPSANGANTSMETAVTVDLEGKKEPGVVIHQCDDYVHCYHSIRLDPASYLHDIIGSETGVVTSNHHQAVLTLGNGMKINAQSSDGIIEGIEWKDAREKSFMVGVQWHPERMDLSNPFSGKLLQKFIEETKKYALKLQNVK